MQTATTLIRPLAEGPLDIIGDIHGEIEALEALLKHLGYRDDGSHPENRHLVFVGDLCDRGPDSPAVIFKVRNLVESGRAQCVVGNHELNLLRRDRKHGNHWFLKPDATKHHEALAEFGPTVQVAAEQESEILGFFASLPVALERDDLRIVHAAWHPESIEHIRGFQGSIIEAYQHFEDRLKALPGAAEIKAAADAENAPYKDRLRIEAIAPPFLKAHASHEAFHQNHHPLRVLTSGLERIAAVPFFVGGQWRFVERVPWWERYDDPQAVIFGHYWRWFDRHGARGLMKEGFYLFGDTPAHGWQQNLAQRAVAYCVDFSAGVRFRERQQHGRLEGFHGRLAALRWPERIVVFDAEPPPAAQAPGAPCSTAKISAATATIKAERD